MKTNSVFVITDDGHRFMQMACNLASENIDRGGGPFGAVIVKDGEVIAAACRGATRQSRVQPW